MVFVEFKLHAKQAPANVFRGFEARRMVRLMFLKAKEQEERYN